MSTLPERIEDQANRLRLHAVRRSENYFGDWVVEVEAAEFTGFLIDVYELLHELKT